MTNTVVVDAADTSQKPSAITRSPPSAASHTGANSGRRRRLAYSLRMPKMIARPWVVLLAAGGSRRFGSPKQLVTFAGQTLLRRATGVALACRPAGCVVVLGASARRLELGLAGLPVTVVVNRRWRGGLSTSVAAGIAALPARAGAALLLLADQPALGPDDLERLVAAWRRAPRTIVASRHGDILGPPAIFPRTLFPELRRLRGDEGARRLLRDPARRVIEVGMPAAAIDIDRPADALRFSRARAPGRTRRSALSSGARRPRSSGAT